MFFESNDQGKIMICADGQIKPSMIKIAPPEEFSPEEMDKWLIRGGEIIPDPDYKTPEKQPTQGSRIAALEEQNAMLTECLLEMSALVYA